MLLSIAVENWRSHKDTKLEFSKGTNLLIGIMGSGKSSILDAISFALFGTFPALERRKLSLSDVIRLNELTAKTTLEFLWNEEKYWVIRRIERKKETANTDAEIYKNEKIVEKGTTAVNKYIEQLLHVDYDLFTRAIYSEQNNIDYFLMLDPRRRKQEMDSLLGLDRFEEARANCTSLLNKIKTGRKDFEEKFSKTALDDSKKQISEVSEHLENIGKENTKLTNAVVAEKQKIELKQKEFSEMQKRKEGYDKAAKEQIIFETKVASLAKELEGKTPNEAELKEIEEKTKIIERGKVQLDENIRELERKTSSLSVSIGALDAKIKLAQKNKGESAKITARLDELLNDRTKEELLTEHEGMLSLIQSLDAEIQFLRSKVNEIEDSSKKLKPGTAECPICGNELGDSAISELLKKKKEDVASLTSQMENKTKNLAELKQKIVKMKELIREVELLSSRFEIVSRDISVEPLAEELAKFDSELLSIRKEREERNAKREKIANEIKELQTLYKEKELLLKKIAMLKEAELGLKKAKENVTLANYDEKTYEQIRSELETVRILFERLSAKKNQLESELKSNSEIRLLLEREIKKMLEMEMEIGSLIKLEEELSIYKNALVQTQTSMRSELISYINEAMNEIWGIIYPYRDYKMLRLSASEKDYQFEVHDTEWKTLESVASGGERACAALTLRVALAMVLTPNLSWLILDEPTHNLDKEAVELLSQTLQTKVPEVVDQTFVITHEEALMGSDFASSYRLSRDKENMESTKVEKI